MSPLLSAPHSLFIKGVARESHRPSSTKLHLMNAFRKSVLRLGVIGACLMGGVSCESTTQEERDIDLYNSVVARSGGGYDQGSQIADDYQSKKGVFAPSTKKN